MPTFNGVISGFAQGDSVSRTVTVTSVPANDTLAKAWLTVKALITDADPGIFQKVIVPTATVGQGQITDTGVSGTGVLRFDLQSGDTALLTPNTSYFYDVKVKTASGLI